LFEEDKNRGVFRITKNRSPKTGLSGGGSRKLRGGQRRGGKGGVLKMITAD